MCLIAFAWKADPRYDLIVAANRDEFVARPTASLHIWAEGDLIAGRDLRDGGTWMGFNRAGTFCALTNFRNSGASEGTYRSRGEIVVEVLRTSLKPLDGLEALRSRRDFYRGFNFVVADRSNAWVYESTRDRLTSIKPGLYALSNGPFEAPWPKSQRAIRALRQTLGSDQGTAILWSMLADKQPAQNDDLPDTGVSPDRERALSAPFVSMEHYQTVSSTIAIRSADRLAIEERRWSEPRTRSHINF